MEGVSSQAVLWGDSSVTKPRPLGFLLEMAAGQVAKITAQRKATPAGNCI